MKPLSLIGHTRRLHAPANWNTERDGECAALEICDADGFMTSAWLPSIEERRRIADGAPVYLHIGGTPQTQHPVVGFTIGTTAHVVMPEPTLTGTNCADCGMPQYDTPSGVSCINGHGGADSE